MAAAAYRDDPWRRVPWLLPSAAGITLLALIGFLKLLAGPPFVTPPAPALEVEVVELAPSPLRAPPAPPPPPASEPPPLAMEPPPPPPLPQSPPPPAPDPPVLQALPPPPLTANPEPALAADTKLPPPPPITPVKPPPPPPRLAAQPQRAAPRPPAAASSPPLAAAPVPPSPAPAPAVASLPPNGGNMGARAIYQPLPEIPAELRRRAIDLVAVARFRVAANGSAEVELIEAAPDAALNRALVETLKKWRFFPAMEAGKPVASTLEIRIPISVR